MALGICLACLTGLAVYGDQAWRHHLQNDSEQEALGAQIARLGVHKPVSAAPPRVQTAADVEHHNSTVRQLDIPWSEVFDGLERNASGKVGLTSLEPDTKAGVLHVQAEGRNIDELLVYAKQLAGDEAFSDLVLHQHATNELDPNRPARLTFDVRLAPQPLAGGDHS